jgi:hypothetical protein
MWWKVGIGIAGAAACAADAWPVGRSAYAERTTAPIERTKRFRMLLERMVAPFPFRQPLAVIVDRGGTMLDKGRLVVARLMALMTATAAAQLAGSSGIAGVVRDWSGAVLPGVTVEASRRVVAKVEHHVGELFPRVGFIVTISLPQSCRGPVLETSADGGSCR